MGLFTRKKIEEKKDNAVKIAQVKGKESMKDLYDSGGVEKTKEVKEAKKEKKYGGAYRVLINPMITEKASVMAAENKYIFEISPKTNKIEIGKAMEEIYGIKPISVNIIKIKGKNVRHGRVSGKRKDRKKAIIKLPAGQSIKVYEGV